MDVELVAARCAATLGATGVRYLCQWHGYDVWKMNMPTSDGLPLPTGVPKFVLTKGESARLTKADEGFAVLEYLHVNDGDQIEDE